MRAQLLRHSGGTALIGRSAPADELLVAIREGSVRCSPFASPLLHRPPDFGRTTSDLQCVKLDREQPRIAGETGQRNVDLTEDIDGEPRVDSRLEVELPSRQQFVEKPGPVILEPCS